MQKMTFSTNLKRIGFNFFPVFRRTGARITYLSDDWLETDLKLPLNWQTKNYVGTIYGGTMYSAVDGIYMVMLINQLGKGYICWDKSATINYLKPGREMIYCQLKLLPEEITEIKTVLQTDEKTYRRYQIVWTNKAGEKIAMIEKEIVIKRK